MEREIIGAKELEAIDGKRSTAVTRAVAKTSPILANCIVEFAYGDIFARAELGRRERELITVALLGAMGGAETQLRVHLSAALRCGAEYDELIAICEHLAPYAGFPRALNAISELRALMEERGIDRPAPARPFRLSDHETLLSDTGSGEPMVLLHSIALDWRVWRDVIPALAKKRRVLAYDLRAHGHAAAASRPISLQRWADDLADLLDSLSIEKAHVAGLSLGGTIAQQFALSHPDRLRSLGLVCTIAKGDPELAHKRAEAAKHHGMQAQVASTLMRWFAPEVIAENPWYVRYARERVIREIVDDWADSWCALGKCNTLEQLGKIKVPTRVIAGECDTAATPAVMKEIASRIPGAKFTVIPHGTHMLALTRPHEVADALLAH